MAKQENTKVMLIGIVAVMALVLLFKAPQKTTGLATTSGIESSTKTFTGTFVNNGLLLTKADGSQVLITRISDGTLPDDQEFLQLHQEDMIARCGETDCPLEGPPQCAQLPYGLCSCRDACGNRCEC